MEEKKITSVEELDAFLLTLTADDIEDEVEEEIDPSIQTEVDITHVGDDGVEDEDELAEEEEIDESDDVVEEEVIDDDENTDPEPHKETKEEKQERQRNYAMGKLRKEKIEATQKAEVLEEEARALRELTARLMKESGYSDLNEFKNAVETQLSEKEMKEKGYTKEQYTEIERLRKENDEFKSRLSQTETYTRKEKAKTFDNLVDTYADKAKVKKSDVYTSLQEQGYTVEMLLNQPNPELLIKGVLADKLTVVKQVVKKQVDTQKLTSKGNTKQTKVDLDDLVKQELTELYSKK